MSLYSESYVMHISRHECSGCGNCWESSQIYLATVRGSDRKLDLVIGDLNLMVPIGISRLAPRQVPICFSCADEAHDLRKHQLAEREQRWQETLRRKAAEERSNKPNGSPAPKRTHRHPSVPETRLEDL